MPHIVAFALGLIEDHLRAELRQIGTIRNKFAHNFRRVRFSDPEIAKLCDRLKELEGTLEADEPMKLYGASCFLCMTALFVIGQVVLASRSAQPVASPENE